LSYQWIKNGAAISGATSASYTISSAASTDAGSYAVAVVNTVSSVASASVISTAVSLTVNAVVSGPTITQQPAPQSVTVGQAATFTVVATGTGTLSYQWTKGGVAISGATSASYTISSTANGDAGNYAVLVTNTVLTVASVPVTSMSVSLTVNAAPVGPTITQQPTAQSVTAGQAVRFTVAATGSGTLSYQWSKAGVAIAGATSAAYVITSPASGDAGSYAVKVTNSVSSVTSTSVSLTVNAAPVGPAITTQPTAQSVTVGQSVSFTVAATGSGNLSYQWAKAGVAISGATSATYTIANVANGDAGLYAVLVTNAVSSVTSTSVGLTVNVAPVGPKITQQPAPQSATTGQSVSFTVAATGSGTLSYQWSKAGVAIAGATSATYTIPSVASGDAGLYAVAVTNAVSSVTSTSVSLAVSTAAVGPTITTQPSAQSVLAGQPASFTVVATGSGILTYQWTKNGNAIAGVTTPTYTFAGAAIGDTGSYAVVVTNSVGSVTSVPAALVVMKGSNVTNPDGSAVSTTGGAAGQTVWVSTASDFQTYAQASSPYVIYVAGIINLGGSVSVKSNKTIQGVDYFATVVGCLDLSSGGVNNVIIRGLNITNPGTTIANGAYTDGGDGIIIRNASNVFVTHCSLFDCAGDQIEISHGSDYVTVSWSEFYYTSAQTVHRSSLITGIAGSETKPLHISLHHNMWSDSCDQHMPSGTYGYVHLYNNYFSAPGNTSTTDARDYSQFFVEQNSYEQVNDPLYKENVDTTLPGGRILNINNLFTGCTGKTADAGTDTVFTPTYSYELLPAADVAMVTSLLSGNTSGASSGTPTASSASISGPTDVVVAGTAFTLTAAPSGFTGVSYQWRLNNFAISGATASTYSVSSAQNANGGTYTVVIGLAAGDYVVSSPLTITLGTSGGSTGGSGGGATAAASTGGGGGGGAPSVWYLALIGALAFARARKKFAR
jgi:pectate lyase